MSAGCCLIDDDTIRTWHRLFEEDGVDGLADFNYGGRACQLTLEQQATLKAWVGETLPRTTREVGAWIEQEFGIVYESRSGLIALLHRLGWNTASPKRCRASSTRPNKKPSSTPTLRC